VSPGQIQEGDIYQRLVKEGFIFTMDDGEKILMKRFNSYIF
jgi:hypothetical protein